MSPEQESHRLSVHLFASCDGTKKRTRATMIESIVSCAAILDICATMVMMMIVGCLVITTPSIIPRTLVEMVLCALVSLLGVFGIIWKFSVWVQINMYYHACSECGSVITQNKTGVCDSCLELERGG